MTVEKPLTVWYNGNPPGCKPNLASIGGERAIMQERERKYRGPRMDWWREPEPVDLKVEHVVENPIFPGERFVRFRVNGKMYTGFFPDRYVSQKNKVLSALIVGDVKEGWFVRIPAETFQGGPQVIVPDAEKETLIVRHRENAPV